MAAQGKMVFSKDGKSKKSDLLKFTIHEQLAMESPSDEEDDAPIEDTGSSNVSKDIKAMEARHQSQLRSEKAQIKENLMTEFARKSVILEKEVKKVLLTILKAEPSTKKYLLKIQKLLNDFTKEASKD